MMRIADDEWVRVFIDFSLGKIEYGNKLNDIK